MKRLIQTEQYLETAKRAVEVAIEEGEEMGMKDSLKAI